MSPPATSWRDPRGGPEEPERTLVGTIDVVTYHDDGSLYTVLRLVPEEGYDGPTEGSLFSSPRLTAVGRIEEPNEGARVRLVGRWGRHPTHGRQFEFEGFEPMPPASRAGLVRYLASKAFEGVGETLAERIVAKLGLEALDAIRERPECLDGIRGLRADVAQKLAAAVAARARLHKTNAFLHGLGFGPLQTQAIVRKLGPDCEGLVRTNPYALTAVTGLGFPTADKIALQLGFDEDDPRRLAAGIAHALEIAADDGHSLQRVGDLFARAGDLFRRTFERELLVGALEGLEADRRVALDRELSSATEPFDDGIPAYLPRLLASERGLAENLAALVAHDVRPLATAERVSAIERLVGISLHVDQKSAVESLLAAPVALLTGGPGVGKTTIIRLVAAIAEEEGLRIKLASPTGRAAKRLAEATGRDASTIHRLLRFSPADGGFEHDDRKPLKAGLVIIDEISMLDVVLAHHLVKAIAPPTRVVLVGDPDQLPSVGPGNVLADLIASCRVPVSRLTRIYRQDQDSLIVRNAHRILAGDSPTFPAKGDHSSDFYFFPADSPEQAADRLIEVVTERIPGTFGYDWVKDVQVIAPMYRGACGVDALNDRLREAQGVGGREVVQGRRRWRVGDRVIHTRNDYDKEVFNGDMGRIVDVDFEGVLTVEYPEQQVTYRGAELSDLKPGFAITVHRSQGGEFPVVVVPLVPQHYVMLQRNLLYTAITRAQKLVVVVGSRRALEMAIANADQSLRESTLGERLRRLLPDPAAH